jgi:hypothetical protein
MRVKRLILLFILFPLISPSQSADEVLSNFFAVQVDETVFIRWTITAGNTCEDTYIERSADGSTYERIGLIGGICGSPDQSITYDFTDLVPLVNRTSWYRLVLGYYGFSSPKTVEFTRFNEKGFLLAPNPFSDFTRLAFENKDSEEHKLVIIDMQGNIVEEMMTTGDEFLIQSLNKTAGVYIFQVMTAGQVIYQGKLIVL